MSQLINHDLSSVCFIIFNFFYTKYLEIISYFSQSLKHLSLSHVALHANWKMYTQYLNTG